MTPPVVPRWKDRGDARSHRPLADFQGAFPFSQGDMPDSDAGEIGDRVFPTDGQIAGLDSVLTCAVT